MTYYVINEGFVTKKLGYYVENEGFFGWKITYHVENGGFFLTYDVILIFFYMMYFYFQIL